MAIETTDRKAMLMERYTAAVEDEEEVATPEVEEPAAEAEVVEPAAAAEEQEAAPEGETPEEKTARERDEKGRFAAAAKEGKEKPVKAPKAAPVAAPPKAAAAAPPKPAAPVVAEPPKPGSELKAPASWTPVAREAWKDVPPAAKQEIHRLEGETRRVLSDNANLRKAHGEVSQRWSAVEKGLGPFEGIFRAQGQDPLSGAMSVVQTYAALHYGSQPQKDAILHNLISQFGSIDGLNALIEGKAPAAAPAPQRQQPQVDIQAAIQAGVREQFETLQQQVVSTRAEKDLEAFQATSPEFLNDVWDSMQTVLDTNAQRGRNLTYQQAYDLAVRMDDGIQGILKQRAEAEAATRGSATAPAQRARTAAATVRSRPAAVGTPVDANDRRAMLEKMARGS